MFKYLVLCTVLQISLAVEFKIRNYAPYTLWIGSLGNPGKGNPNNGGFVLNSKAELTLSTADDWAGRFWARTGCDSGSKHCQTGDCGNRLECAGNGGTPPASLAEFTLRGSGGQDFYDISLVDGFNVKISIEPVGGTGGKCRRIGCDVDLNPDCPGDLKVPGGCASSCFKYNTDAYCCRGAYGSPSTCKPSPYANYVKPRCPDAYSYAYDDASSTFTCTGTRQYIIAFG